MSKKCNHCGVYVLDDAQKCPLCNGVIEGQDEGIQTYPNVVDKIKKLNIIMRMLLAVWAGTFICLGVLSYYKRGALLPVVIAGASCLYFLFMIWLMTKPEAGYMKRIFGAIIVGVILVVGIDITLGFKRWSLNYVLPGGLILMDIALIILRVVNKRNWQGYMAQQLMVIFMGLLPAFFIWKGWISDPIVSVVAICESIVLFVVTLIMGGRAARMELRRRFHIK
ncbi:MAG: hypothetical protein K6F30_01080 [Lachnospiraceae bacterium]|nr:hypothetical protein [Lachnospiraceae bacterium]